MIVKNARNSLHALGCVMTLDLLINFEVNPNFISCGRISYKVGTLVNKSKGRGKLLCYYMFVCKRSCCYYMFLIIVKDAAVMICFDIEEDPE